MGVQSAADRLSTRHARRQPSFTRAMPVISVLLASAVTLAGLATVIDSGGRQFGSVALADTVDTTPTFPDPTPTDPTSDPAVPPAATSDPVGSTETATTTTVDPPTDPTSTEPTPPESTTQDPTATESATAPPPTSPTPTTTPPTVDQVIAAAPRGSALRLVGSLKIKGRAPKTGYTRTTFGPAWADADRNGCDTRNDILRRDLRRDLRRLSLKAGTHGCVVLSGGLGDPYTSRTLQFRRGGAAEVDIDHVVALSNAWQTGARSWATARRQILANDPLNLLAVSSSANRAKGDSDTATWLPPNRSYRCPYVARQVAVKAKYGLWVTPPERVAMVRVLAGCRTLKPPTGGLPLTGKPKPTPKPPTPAPKPPKPTPQPPTLPTVSGTVHPGAFCSPHGWYGYTSAGTLMRCITSPTDARYRWRRA